MAPPWATELSHHAPHSLTDLTNSRITLRDYINIYIIKYKSKKNGVKKTLWKKNIVGFFIFCFSVAVVVVVILFTDPHISLRNKLQYISALKVQWR